eukprot:Sdes_comp20670_c0_seq1m16022
MAFLIRTSKLRHVYGSTFKKDECYDGVRVTRNAWDSNFCAVNPQFLAVVLESGGGGSFLVVPLSHHGKLPSNYPTFCGHKGAVLDIAFHPFNDNVVASASEDCTVMVWNIPGEGVQEDVRESAVVLAGHGRKVGQIVWHPTAENILFSSSADLTIRVWNVLTGACVFQIENHGDSIYDMSFNYDGSQMATTCKDKKLRIFNSRTGEVLKEGASHLGTKASRVVWLGKSNLILTTGFSRQSERQLFVWDASDLAAPVRSETVDTSSGVLMPFYDQDLNILYVGGKGDGNIRYYEVVDEKPFLFFINEFKTSMPQRGFGFMPKRGCDVSQCEIARFYKLHSSGLIEPIRMIVPRKSDMFQDDIFPDSSSYRPSLTADEWIRGKNADPILTSLKDGFKPPEQPVVLASVQTEAKSETSVHKPSSDQEVSR